jgi:hypothetical protein
MNNYSKLSDFTWLWSVCLGKILQFYSTSHAREVQSFLVLGNSQLVCTSLHTETI